MDNGGGNGAGCFEVETWADTAKFTNVIVAGFRRCKNLVGEGKVFIKDKAKVASRVGCSERRVVHFKKLLFKSDKKKLSFRRVESQKVCSHPIWDSYCKFDGRGLGPTLVTCGSCITFIVYIPLSEMK